MNAGELLAVAAAGVAKTYPNGTHALAPIDLSVRAGEFVTLLGPSGCGKSTLLNLLAGLIAPSQGTLRWWGTPTPDFGAEHRGVAFVFQAPTLMPWTDVANNVRLPLDLAGVPRERAVPMTTAALDQVGLSGFARHYPRELSGGMQMRVSIARALATQPDLLLLDEPFGALDEFNRQRLDDELLSLWSSRRMTVVFVTHSIAEAVYLSTRVVVMAARPGRILAEELIDADYPRAPGFRISTQFAQYAQRLTEHVMRAGVAIDAETRR